MPTSARKQNKAQQSAGASPRPTDSPFSSTNHDISPTHKQKKKTGDCSPAFSYLFFTLPCAIHIIGIEAIVALGAGREVFIAYFFTAVVNTATGTGHGENKETVKRFNLHLRSTVTSLHVKILL